MSGKPTFRLSVSASIDEVLERMSSHVLADASAAETTPWPPYQGEVRDTRFELITPPEFARKGSRSRRMPISIIGTLTATKKETLVEARVSLTGWSRWFVFGFPLVMPLVTAVLFCPIAPLNHRFFVTVVGIASGVAAVLCLLSAWLSLKLGAREFRDVLEGHARR